MLQGVFSQGNASKHSGCELDGNQEAHKVSPVIPPAYTPDYITSFIYSVSEGRLTGHCDKILGWVVLFSLGCTAKWWLQSPQLAKTGAANTMPRSCFSLVIDFESGDVLVFNGGTEWNIFHGIDTIVANTAPQFLPTLSESRISLQLRQTERNDNPAYLARAKRKERRMKDTR